MKEDVSTFKDFSKFEKNIAMAFVHLVASITEHLEKAKFTTMRRACIVQIKTPTGAKLSPTAVENINATKNLDELLDILALSPYWSWIDVRLLEALVTASGSATAEAILFNYKKVIFSKKVHDILPSAPSKEVSDEYYAKIVSKLDKDADDITVADLLKFQSKLEKVIMDIGEGTCVLEHIEDGCIKIHWFIPTHTAHHAFESASSRSHIFHEIQLIYLQIGTYPTIFDPLATEFSQSTSSEPQTRVTAGKIYKKFISSLNSQVVIKIFIIIIKRIINHYCHCDLIIILIYSNVFSSDHAIYQLLD